MADQCPASSSAKAGRGKHVAGCTPPVCKSKHASSTAAACPDRGFPPGRTLLPRPPGPHPGFQSEVWAGGVVRRRIINYPVAQRNGWPSPYCRPRQRLWGDCYGFPLPVAGSAQCAACHAPRTRGEACGYAEGCQEGPSRNAPHRQRRVLGAAFGFDGDPVWWERQGAGLASRQLPRQTQESRSGGEVPEPVAGASRAIGPAHDVLARTSRRTYRRPAKRGRRVNLWWASR